MNPEFLIEMAKKRVEYNAHDLGEFGKMIRVEYVNNILEDMLVAIQHLTKNGAE